MINVTKTFLPDKEKYMAYVDEIFANGWVTNHGPLLRRLEKRLAAYLGVKNVVLVANGTAALEIAYRTLALSGEVITTPFSFVATTSSLVTNGLRPVFADIDPQTFNIDPAKIESHITPDTSAIVPVHVFGNACDVEQIAKVAERYELKVIYDAAHAFDVKFKDESILKQGDISTLSFHATKLFHTIEGGALIINDDALVEKARYLINFGIEDEESIPELGTNAKMNEFEAAMGLSLLDDVEGLIQKRKYLYEHYKAKLKDRFVYQGSNKASTQNYGYFPIVLEDEDVLLKLMQVFKENGIAPRRYFYPSLDTLSYIEPKQVCKVSRALSKKILCLPIYPTLASEEQTRIIDILLENI